LTLMAIGTAVLMQFYLIRSGVSPLTGTMELGVGAAWIFFLVSLFPDFSRVDVELCRVRSVESSKHAKAGYEQLVVHPRQGSDSQIIFYSM